MVKEFIDYLTMRAHRQFKDSLYGLLARAGKALSNPHRIELLELLAQSERSVDSLAQEMGLSKANTSQHLQALRDAGLVESRKDGLFVHYRLSDPAVFELVWSLRTVAERRFAELEQLVREHFTGRADGEAIGMKDLLKRVRAGDVIVLDARPSREFVAGHIPGAISMPVDEIKKALHQLPRGRDIVAYCRGPYCIYADRAVEVLTRAGRHALRLAEGFPEWKAAGLPVEVQPQ